MCGVRVRCWAHLDLGQMEMGDAAVRRFRRGLVVREAYLMRAPCASAGLYCGIFLVKGQLMTLVGVPIGRAAPVLDTNLGSRARGLVECDKLIIVTIECRAGPCRML